MQPPLIMAHMATRHYGRENSVEVLLQVTKYRPDIVELDLRKSRDGVLFCYHGRTLLGCLMAYFLRFFSFKTIHQWLRVNRLRELVAVLPREPILFLDFKQRNISTLELVEALGTTTNEIWLAAFSLAFLAALHAHLGDRFVYVYNFGFWRLQRGLTLAKKHGIGVCQLFFWQTQMHHWQTVSEAGLRAAVCSFFLPRRRYVRLAKQYPSLWVYYDDLSEAGIIQSS